MNIFFLHEDPRTCAQYHYDKHVVKMVLETAQLLSTATYLISPDTPRDIYKPTHVGHPCTQWVKTSKENFLWLCYLGVELSNEYSCRFKKRHKSSQVINYIFHYSHNITKELPTVMTELPTCMPDEYKLDNVVNSYRNYYCTAKKHIASYTNRSVPKFVRDSYITVVEKKL